MHKGLNQINHEAVSSQASSDKCGVSDTTLKLKQYVSHYHSFDNRNGVTSDIKARR